MGQPIDSIDSIYGIDRRVDRRMGKDPDAQPQGRVIGRGETSANQPACRADRGKVATNASSPRRTTVVNQVPTKNMVQHSSPTPHKAKERRVRDGLLYYIRREKR